MRASIARALAKSPDERFKSVTEFIEAFEKEGAGAQVTVVQSGPVSRQPSADAVTAPGPSASPAAAPAYTPAAMPQIAPAPPPEAGGGGKRGLILGIAGVLAVGSAIAIAVGVSGGGKKHVAPKDDGGLFGVSDLVVLDGSGAGAGSAAVHLDDSILGLSDGGAAHDASHAFPVADGGHVPPPPPPPPPHDAGSSINPNEPKACANARMMKKLGRMEEYETLAAKCRSLGGTP
jgi:hypothetical protein